LFNRLGSEHQSGAADAGAAPQVRPGAERKAPCAQVRTRSPGCSTAAVGTRGRNGWAQQEGRGCSGVGAEPQRIDTRSIFFFVKCLCELSA